MSLVYEEIKENRLWCTRQEKYAALEQLIQSLARRRHLFELSGISEENTVRFDLLLRLRNEEISVEEEIREAIEQLPPILNTEMLQLLDRQRKIRRTRRRRELEAELFFHEIFEINRSYFG